MARKAGIPKSEYAHILRMADEEKLRTADIARQYDIVPRTIYIILDKARAARSGDAPTDGVATVATLIADAISLATSDQSVAMQPDAVSCPRFQEPEEPHLPPPITDGAVPETDGVPVVEPDVVQPHPEACAVGIPAPERRTSTARTYGSPSPKASVSAPASRRAAPKSGAYGLVMRPDDADEMVQPFRSLDELLSSVRGVLRQAAQAPAPVWFTIREIDLTAFEM